MIPISQSSSGSETLPDSDPQAGQACIANISSHEKRKRLAAGVVVFAFSLVAFWLLRSAGAGRALYLALFFPFYVAAVCFFQWRDST